MEAIPVFFALGGLFIACIVLICFGVSRNNDTW